MAFAELDPSRSFTTVILLQEVHNLRNKVDSLVATQVTVKKMLSKRFNSKQSSACLQEPVSLFVRFVHLAKDY